MNKRTMIRIVLLSVVFLGQARPVLSQDGRLNKIEERLNALEQRGATANNSHDSIKSYVFAAFAILGTGLFCGLWARNSGRDFWLWFVAGLVFTVFALIAVLEAHEKDKKTKKDAAKKASKETLDL